MADRSKPDDPTGADAPRDPVAPKPKVTRARTTPAISAKPLGVKTPVVATDATSKRSPAPIRSSAAGAGSPSGTAAPVRPAAGPVTPPAPIVSPATVLVPAQVSPAGDVEVGILNIRNGGINVAKATTVDVHQGGISRVEARDVAVTMGGIAIARADRVSAEMSGVALALAGEARVSQSFVRALVARDVRLEQGAIWSVLANKVTFGRQSFAGVVIARRVDGNVRTLLDWRGALALAGVVGVVMAVVRRR
jgi:hypothetical protein